MSELNLVHTLNEMFCSKLHNSFEHCSILGPMWLVQDDSPICAMRSC
jgi:hypothetical protein